MRFAKRLTVAALALTVATGLAQAKDWKEIRVGTDATYAPFESQDSSGKIVGFDIDIMNAVCADIKATCTYVNQDFDGIIPALQAGKFDVIVSSLSITPEREKIIDFTDKYYNAPSAIVVPKDSDIKGATKADLAGKTVGVQSSTTFSNYVEKVLTDSTEKVYPAVTDAELDLANGRLDALNDDIVVLTTWLGTSDGACCKLAGTIKPIPEIHGPGEAFGVRKEDTDLKALLNKGIADILADGTYKKINDKYFTFNAYGD
jgi:polar amino acid transport system substrate-binding protein